MQQPPGGNLVAKSLLMGCGALLAVLMVAGGVATWFAVHAVHTVLARGERVVSVARNVVASAQQADPGPAGASPDPVRGAANGIAVLKAFVTGGKSHVDSVPRAVLATVLPSAVDALARSNVHNSKTSISGISGTSASATYARPGRGAVNIEVTDGANMTGLTTVMDLAMGAVTSENDEGYQRNVELGGVRVHEGWANAGNHAALLGLVADRFVVSVESDGLGMPSTEQAFRSVDIAKLRSLAASASKR